MKPWPPTFVDSSSCENCSFTWSKKFIADLRKKETKQTDQTNLQIFLPKQFVVIRNNTSNQLLSNPYLNDYKWLQIWIRTRLYLFGGFQSMRLPQSSSKFRRIFHRPSIFGLPPFMESPIWHGAGCGMHMDVVIPYIIPKDMGMCFFRLEAPKMSKTRGDVASAAAGGSGIAGGRVLPEGWSPWRVASLKQGERYRTDVYVWFSFYFYIINCMYICNI